MVSFSSIYGLNEIPPLDTSVGWKKCDLCNLPQVIHYNGKKYEVMPLEGNAKKVHLNLHDEIFVEWHQREFDFFERLWKRAAVICTLGLLLLLPKFNDCWYNDHENRFFMASIYNNLFLPKGRLRLLATVYPHFILLKDTIKLDRIKILANYEDVQLIQIFWKSLEHNHCTLLQNKLLSNIFERIRPNDSDQATRILNIVKLITENMDEKSLNELFWGFIGLFCRYSYNHNSSYNHEKIKDLSMRCSHESGKYNIANYKKTVWLLYKNCKINFTCCDTALLSKDYTPNVFQATYAEKVIKEIQEENAAFEFWKGKDDSKSLPFTLPLDISVLLLRINKAVRGF